MPHPNQSVAVIHPDHGLYEALDPGKDYDPTDPLVKKFPQFFTPVENAGQIIDSVSVEDTSAVPGAKRRVTTRGK